ncbi:hypothetical protein N184_28695 [Sinorhizobium sp. GL28]|nr:hypothetical protein N184_28695 [Sinorhizobium sp. GL28]
MGFTTPFGSVVRKANRSIVIMPTRGRDFPLAMLASRLRCPRCGSRLVSVVFIPPTDGDLRRGAA